MNYLDNPKHSYGTNLEDYGIDELIRHGRWETGEKDKSSKISTIPARDIIIKEKERSLDKTIYEAYNTILFSTLFEKYDINALGNESTRLYSPETLRIEYGNKKDPNNNQSAIFEPFCQGKPLNKLPNSRGNSHSVQSENVRIGSKATFLTGIISEILEREGLHHGDLSLRHTILLPEKGDVLKTYDDGKPLTVSSNNGIGLIDVENAYITGPNSSDIESDIEKFEETLRNKFNHWDAGKYFEKGRDLIKKRCKNKKWLDEAKKNSLRTLRSRFDQNLSVKLEGDPQQLQDKRVIYDQKEIF